MRHSLLYLLFLKLFIKSVYHLLPYIFDLLTNKLKIMMSSISDGTGGLLDQQEPLLGHSLSWEINKPPNQTGTNRFSAKVWVPEIPTESDLINISSYSNDFHQYLSWRHIKDAIFSETKSQRFFRTDAFEDELRRCCTALMHEKHNWLLTLFNMAAVLCCLRFMGVGNGWRWLWSNFKNINECLKMNPTAFAHDNSFLFIFICWHFIQKVIYIMLYLFMLNILYFYIQNSLDIDFAMFVKSINNFKIQWKEIFVVCWYYVWRSVFFNSILRFFY